MPRGITAIPSASATREVSMNGDSAPEQKETLHRLMERLKEDYPEARVVGHRDLPGVKKDCPCFEVCSPL